jgi:hypothetical protein
VVTWRLREQPRVSGLETRGCPLQLSCCLPVAPSATDQYQLTAFECDQAAHGEPYRLSM